MRLSNLLWIVALFIVMCVRGSQHQPRMHGKREDSQTGANIDSEGVSSKLDDQLKSLKNWDGSADDSVAQRVSQCDVLTPTTSTCESIEPTFSTTCQTPRSTDCDPFHANPNQQQQYPPQQQQQCQQQQQPQYAPAELDDSEQRGKELRKLVQHLYVAQARVQLEATEIHKAQAVASSAQAQLENTANHVRTITATLHNAQQEVAAAAIRAQIAQLQLAAHDQLLFAARQDVDSLSSQVVGLQAAEGIVQPKLTVDLHALLDKLRLPLQHFDRPTPVPMIITPPPLNEEGAQPAPDSDVGASVGVPHEVGQNGNGKQQEHAKAAI